MQFLVPRVAGRVSRFTAGPRPIHGNATRTYTTSTVVAVLRTSKFRRLCNDYIRGATADRAGIATITEERDNLANQGLLDARSQALYDQAWQLSQSGKTPQPPMYYPYPVPAQYTSFHQEAPLPPFQVPNQVDTTHQQGLPPTQNFYQASSNQNLAQSPNPMQPPHQPQSITPPQPRSPKQHKTRNSPSPQQPPSKQNKEPTSSSLQQPSSQQNKAPITSSPQQPSSQQNKAPTTSSPQQPPSKQQSSKQQSPSSSSAEQPPSNSKQNRVPIDERTPEARLIDGLMRGKYELATEFWRKVETIDLFQFQTLLTLAIENKDFDACIEILEKYGKPYADQPEVLNASFTSCLLGAIAAQNSNFATKFADHLKEKGAMRPATLANIANFIAEQDQPLAQHLVDIAATQHTGKSLEKEGYQALVAHLSKSSDAIPRASRIILETGQPIETVGKYLFPYLANQGDVAGCKLVLELVTYTTQYFDMMRDVKDVLVEGPSAESVKTEAKVILDSPRTLWKIGMIRALFYEKIDPAFEIYKEFNANKDPSDTERISLSIFSEAVRSAFFLQKPEIVEQILQDHKEHRVLILGGAFNSAITGKRRNDEVASKILARLTQEDPAWLRTIPRATFIRVCRYALLRRNTELVSECLKLWTPSEAFFLVPSMAKKNIMKILYAHLVKSNAIARDLARRVCLLLECDARFEWTTLLDLGNDLARHGDLLGCTFVDSFALSIGLYISINKPITDHIINGSVDESIKAQAQQFLTAFYKTKRERKGLAGAEKDRRSLKAVEIRKNKTEQQNTQQNSTEQQQQQQNTTTQQKPTLTLKQMRQRRNQNLRANNKQQNENNNTNNNQKSENNNNNNNDNQKSENKQQSRNNNQQSRNSNQQSRNNNQPRNNNNQQNKQPRDQNQQHNKQQNTQSTENQQKVKDGRQKDNSQKDIQQKDNSLQQKDNNEQLNNQGEQTTKKTKSKRRRDKNKGVTQNASSPSPSSSSSSSSVPLSSSSSSSNAPLSSSSSSPATTSQQEMKA